MVQILFVIAKIIISQSLLGRVEALNQVLEDLNLQRKHPDVLYIEDEAKLGVEQSQQIRSFLSIRPYSALGRVVVLESAHKLTREAQNALLKILEEPPNQAVILLGAASTSALLPTILSRCQIVQLEDAVEEDSKFFDQIASLIGKSEAERFAFIEKLEEKEVFLDAMVAYFRQKMIADPSKYQFAQKLLQAEEWKESNVNIRAILEYLMLEMM